MADQPKLIDLGCDLLKRSLAAGEQPFQYEPNHPVELEDRELSPAERAFARKSVLEIADGE